MPDKDEVRREDIFETDSQTEETPQEEEQEENSSGGDNAETQAPSQAGGSEGETPSAGGESGSAGASGTERHHHSRDAQTKALYKKIHKDKKTIEEVKERLFSYNDDVEYATSKKKQNAVAEKLENEFGIIEEVQMRALDAYISESESLPRKHNQKGAQKRIQELARNTELALGLYRKHQRTLENVKSETELYDFDNRLTKLNEERRDFKYNKGKVNYHQYRSLKYRYEDMVMEYKSLSVPSTKAGEELKERIERHIEKERNYLKRLEAYMPKEDLSRMQEKEKEANEQAELLNTHYHAASPFIRLLFKVREVRDKHKEKSTFGDWVKEKAGGAKGFYDEGNELKEQYEKIGESLKDDDDNDDDDDSMLKKWLLKNGKIAIRWLTGKLGGSEKVQNIGEAMLEQLAEWFEPLVNAGKLFKGLKSFISDISDMSWEEAKNQAAELIGNSLEWGLDAIEKLLKKVKNIPIFEDIASIINGAFGVFRHVCAFIDKRKHKNEAGDRKEELKQRMLKKRFEYLNKDETKHANLYGFMGTSQERHGLLWRQWRVNAHVAKSDSEESFFKKDYEKGTTTIERQKAKLEKVAGGENIYHQLEEMKEKKDRDQLSSRERKKYYQLKTLRDIREYTEQKADVGVNRKRMVAEGWEIAHNALDILGSMCSLIPGLGKAIGTGIKFFNATSKFTHSVVSKGKKLFEHMDGTTERKNATRTAMATNMFHQMVYITGFMRENQEDNATPLFVLGPATAKRVSRSMDYISSTTATLSYKMSEMLGAETKEDMIEKMAEAFAAGG